MYDFGRIWNYAGARVWMDDRALPALLKHGDDERFRRELKTNLRLSDQDIDNAIANRQWSQEDYHRAGKAFSDLIMGTGDPTEMPPWARGQSSQPTADSLFAVMRTVYGLKSFEFKVTRILKERLIKEAWYHHNFRPYIPFLLAMGSGEILRQIVAISHGRTDQAKWWLDEKNRNVVDVIERLAGNIARQYAWQSQAYLLGASTNDAGWAAMENIVGPFFSSVLIQPFRFGVEFKNAKSNYARYNAFKRWLNSEIVVSGPLFRAGEAALGYDAAASKKAAAKESAERNKEKRQHRVTSSAGARPL